MRCRLHFWSLLPLLGLLSCSGTGMAPMAGDDFDAGEDCGDADCPAPSCDDCATVLELSWAAGTPTMLPRGGAATLQVRAVRRSMDGMTEVPLSGTVDLLVSPEAAGAVSPTSVALNANGTGTARLTLCTTGTACYPDAIVTVQGVIGGAVSNELEITISGGGTSTDAGRPDAGHPDAGHDAGTPDAGHPDAGHPDAGHSDAGTPDAGPHGCTSDASCGTGLRCLVSTGQCVRCLQHSDCGANAACTGYTCVSTGVCTQAASGIQLTSDANLNVSTNSLSCSGGVGTLQPTCGSPATVRRDACFDGFVLTITSGTGSLRLRLQSDGTRWKAGALLVGGPTLVGNMTEHGLSSPSVLPPPAGTHLNLSFFLEGPSGSVTFFANGSLLSTW